MASINILIPILFVAAVLSVQKTCNGASISMVQTAIPADDQTTSTAKPAVGQDNPSSLVRCYCNLPECMTASDGLPTCTTRNGCFSEIQITLPVTENTTSQTTISPILVPEEFIEGRTSNNKSHPDGAYGCLDLLSMNQTCYMIGKFDNKSDSEFPAIETSKITQNGTGDIIRAYHCCQTDMCNERSQNADTIQAAREALIAAVRKSMSAVNHEEQIKVGDSTSDSNSTTTEAPTANSTASESTQAPTEMYTQNATSADATTTTDVTTTTPVPVGTKNDTESTNGSTDSNTDKFVIYVPSLFNNKTTTEEANTTTMGPIVNEPYVTVQAVGVTDFELYPTKVPEMNGTTSTTTTTMPITDTTELIAPVNVINKREVRSPRMFKVIRKREEQQPEYTTIVPSQEIATDNMQESLNVTTVNITSQPQEFVTSNTMGDSINATTVNTTSQESVTSYAMNDAINTTTVNTTSQESVTSNTMDDAINATTVNTTAQESATSVTVGDAINATTVNTTSQESVTPYAVGDSVNVTTVNTTSQESVTPNAVDSINATTVNATSQESVTPNAVGDSIDTTTVNTTPQEFVASNTMGDERDVHIITLDQSSQDLQKKEAVEVVPTISKPTFFDDNI